MHTRMRTVCNMLAVATAALTLAGCPFDKTPNPEMLQENAYSTAVSGK